MPRISEAKRLSNAARKRRAIKALVKNTPIEVIAAAEGVSSKTISRDLKEHESRLLLVELATRHDADLKQLYAKALKVADAAMDSAEWLTRLRGVREADRLLRTVTIGRLSEPEKDASVNEGLEWEQFIIMRARRMAQPPARR